MQRDATQEQQLAQTLGLAPPARQTEADDPMAQLGGGHPLPSDLREDMESRFDAGFGDVRLHTGASAAQAAKSVAARAFTVGSDVVFGDGESSFSSLEGRRLLAHELTHVLQQRATGARDDSGPAVARARPGEVQREGNGEEPFKVKPIQAWLAPVDSRETGVMAIEPGDSAGKFVGFLRGSGGGPPPRASGSVMAYEHGGESGHGTLTVSIGLLDDVGDKIASPSIRWPDVQLHTYRIAAPQEEPDTPPPSPHVPPKQQPKPPKRVPTKPPVVPPPRQDPLVPEPDRPLFEPTLDPDPAEKKASDAPALTPAQAARLPDAQLGALAPSRRLDVVRAIAAQGNAGDAATLFRLLATTPDSDAPALLDALNADNGQLLAALREKLPTQDRLQLEMSVIDLSMRGSAIPSFASPKLDFTILPGGSQRDPDEVHWLGDPALRPSWTKGLRYWKDDRGNTHLDSPELGTSSWNALGERLDRPKPPGMEQIERAIRGSSYLAQTGGKRYVGGQALDEAQWQAYLQRVSDNYGIEEGGKFGNLQSGVKIWNDIQDRSAPAPKYLAHLFGGRSTDDPDKILQGTAQDIDIARNMILKANTPEELDEALRVGGGVSRYGNYQFYQYKEDIYAGGDRTIVAIKVTAVAATAYVSAPLLLSAGGGAVTLKVVGTGVVLGSGLNAGRQGVEMLQGTRKKFSPGDMALSGAAGGVLPFVPEAAPVLMGMGVSSAADEFSQGHYGTGAFDMVTSVAPIGLPKAMPAISRFVRPRVAGLYLGAATRGVGEIPGLSGFSPTSSLPYEPTMAMVVDSAGRPATGTVDSVVPAANAGTAAIPQVAPRSLGAWNTGADATGAYRPYGSIPYVITFVPQAAAPATPQAQAPVPGLDATAQGYAASPVTIADMQGARGRPRIEIGDTDRYWRLGSSQYLPPIIGADGQPISGPNIRATEGEHPHPTAAVKFLQQNWGKAGSPAIGLAEPHSRIKTPTDNALTKDLKAGRINAQEWLARSRTNIYRSWFEARARGLPVPTAEELADAILAQEAAMQAGQVPVQF